mgnify:CR=1 FL=1
MKKWRVTHVQKTEYAVEAKTKTAAIKLVESLLDDREEIEVEKRELPDELDVEEVK